MNKRAPSRAWRWSATASREPRLYTATHKFRSSPRWLSGYLESGHELAEVDLERLLGFLEQVTVCLQGALGRISSGEEEGDLGLELVSLGGSKLLMELVRTHPALFVRKAGQGQSIQAQEVS